MARNLAVTVVAIDLIFLITLAHARTSLFLPENEVEVENPLADFQDLNLETASGILLPSEKPGSEPDKLVHFEPEPETITATKLTKPERITQTKLPESISETGAEFVPLTVINFPRINGRFLKRPMIHFHRRHRCHHGHQQFRVPFTMAPSSGGPHRIRHDISHVNDMILGNGRPRIPSMRGMAWRKEMERRLLRVAPHGNHRHGGSHHLHDDSDEKFHYHVNVGEIQRAHKRRNGHVGKQGNGFIGSIRYFFNRNV